MFKLSQLNLQLTLMGSSALRENIKNQACTIKHSTLNFTFDISFLAGG